MDKLWKVAVDVPFAAHPLDKLLVVALYLKALGEVEHDVDAQLVALLAVILLGIKRGDELSTKHNRVKGPSRVEKGGHHEGERPRLVLREERAPHVLEIDVRLGEAHGSLDVVERRACSGSTRHSTQNDGGIKHKVDLPIGGHRLRVGVHPIQKLSALSQPAVLEKGTRAPELILNSAIALLLVVDVAQLVRARMQTREERVEHLLRGRLAPVLDARDSDGGADALGELLLRNTPLPTKARDGLAQ